MPAIISLRISDSRVQLKSIKNNAIGDDSISNRFSRYRTILPVVAPIQPPTANDAIYDEQNFLNEALLLNTFFFVQAPDTASTENGIAETDNKTAKINIRLFMIFILLKNIFNRLHLYIFYIQSKSFLQWLLQLVPHQRAQQELLQQAVHVLYTGNILQTPHAPNTYHPIYVY